MIKVENLSFKYKNSNENILKNINFSVNEGEIIAIVGKNGSGKSTLAKLLSGIIKNKNGKIFIDNEDISKDYKNIRNKVGIVFQNPESQILFNNIYDELSFSAKNTEKKELDLKIKQALKQVEMEDFENKDLYELSLGQKQRIMIAEVLVKNPKYIILDEPTTMIDSFGKDKIHEIIKKLKLDGYTIICITNMADEILLADKTIILNEGEIVSEIKKEELIEKTDILKKYGIKLPTVLELLVKLGINLEIKDYTVDELVEKINKKIGEKN